MTTATVMDVIAIQPDCDEKAAEAVSALSQVKMEDASKLLRISKSEYPDIWIRLLRHKWPKSWSNIEDPVVLLERNLPGHPLAGPKYRLGNVYLFIGNKDSCYLFVWMTSQWLERDRIWRPCGRKSWKDVALDEPTSFLDHVYLGCTQRECKPNEVLIEQYK